MVLLLVAFIGMQLAFGAAAGPERRWSRFALAAELRLQRRLGIEISLLILPHLQPPGLL